MNETIDNIIFEAGCPKYCNPHHPDLEGYIVNQEVLNKLIKVIVRDCGEEITKEPFNAGAASDWLKEHFGIENERKD